MKRVRHDETVPQFTKFRRSAKLGALVTTFCMFFMLGSPAQANPEESFVDMLNALQKALAGAGFISSGDGTSDDGPGDGDAGGSGPSAKEYWISDVDPIVQNQCKGCHQTGGTAANSGAQLLFTDSAEDNHLAMQSFVSSAGGSADLVLSKITGGAGHGGGRVISSGSIQYQAFEQYFVLLDGGTAVGVDDGGDFWEGLVIESPGTTLRRASLLLAGRVASPAAIARAETSEKALRGELIKLMRGDGFHEFLISGADDRLLTDGLTYGAGVGIKGESRYPALLDWQQQFPRDYPDGLDTSSGKSFFIRPDAGLEFKWALHREPLELIAHVIETNQSYKKILTADYTMVNPISNIAYRSGVNFDFEFIDEEGFFSRRTLNTFKPGRNRGRVPWDEQFSFDSDERRITSFSDYQQLPHAGVLSTQAWLARYPSTDTNRNRARARWTYFHFLGVDIEKSAPRTTDPDALADTNNPTMNNTACTVCHERMDPLAGAYQLFGDEGQHKVSWGGNHSLPQGYITPELIGGEQGSSPYQQGDTWYRDMRVPGLEGEEPTSDQDSLQWAAKQIADDPRFATATVKFWWPAIFGTDPLALPEDPEGPDYDQRLRAFNAQEALVAELAEKFVAANYRAKHLFADMLMTPWYRTAGVEDSAIAESRSVELATVGSGRLLTPEELDRKNLAVFGRTWGQWYNDSGYELDTALTNSINGFKTFYGGADSAAITTRNRELTSLMGNVSERMAVELACQAVGYDFSLPSEERVIFDIVDRNMLPGDMVTKDIVLPGQIAKDMDAWIDHKPVKLFASSPGGRVRVFFSDATVRARQRTDSDDTRSNLIFQSITFHKAGQETLRVQGVDIPEMDGFEADQWQNDNGESGYRVSVKENMGGLLLGSVDDWVAFEVDLPKGDYDVHVQLGTQLWENNVNDSMNASISLRALENIDQTESTLKVKEQVRSLFLKATNRELTSETIDQVMNQYVEHADEQRQLWWQYGGHCGMSSLWENWRSIGDVATTEEQTADDYRQRFADPRGATRGWIMVAHSILSSAAYLHD